MKKLVLTLALISTFSQGYGGVTYMVATGENIQAEISIPGIMSVTTTSVFAPHLASLVVFLDGEPAVNLASPIAKELEASGKRKSALGEPLTEDELGIMHLLEKAEF